MSRNRLRDVTLILVASALALALVGCGGGGAVSFAEAVEATESADTMRFSMTGTIASAGQSFAMEGQGVADNRAQRTAFSMKMPDPAGGPDIDMQAVLDGTTFYLQIPMLENELPGLKPWIELDLQGLGQEVGVDLQGLIDLGTQNDPLKLLAYLRAAGPVDEVGADQIRGTETTHYRSEVDYARYAEILQEENPRAATAIRAIVRESGGELLIPIDVWIDDDGLVRRQSFEQSMPDGSAMQMTLDLYDYGADVDVALPARKNVTSFAELLEKSGGG